MSNAHAEQWKKLYKIKTFKTRCETLYDKPKEHILNIIVQSSDSKMGRAQII